MNYTRTIGVTTILSKQSAASTVKAFHGTNIASTPTVRNAILILHGQYSGDQRNFSTTRPRRLNKSSNKLIKDFFPPPEPSMHIRTTDAAWHHPVYTQAQMDSVLIAHRNAKTWSDYVALGAIRTMRWCFDLITGYKHGPAVRLHGEDPGAAKQKYAMTERKYMVRNIFLESVAGVPGIVAGMLRHLRSMRRMKRDNGWMETLLEESYNERMHLLTFLQLASPGPLMRLSVLAAQGLFFNAFFLSYLVSPATCHRFVGYLEEEAVITYTREIAALDAGLLPGWEKTAAPPIAVEYWKMPEGHRTMRDLLLYIRADESKHREVNHTLANLNQSEDPNPFVSRYRDEGKVHPTKGIEHPRPTGWERDEVI